jgi:hypothetical protein
LSDTLVTQARREAGTFNRTLSGQIEYWVRLGQAVEAVPGFDMRRVRAALGGQLDAQLLSRDERLVFEENLGEVLAAPSASAAVAMRELREAGAAVGLDGEGRLVRTISGGR